MDGFKGRVQLEHAQLNEKVSKLSFFIADGSAYLQLPVAEALRLTAQLEAMRNYLSVLEQRLGSDFK